MNLKVVNKLTEEETYYDNAFGYDTHGAINGEPVFQLILDNGTATFHKSEFELYAFIRVS